MNRVELVTRGLPRFDSIENAPSGERARADSADARWLIEIEREAREQYMPGLIPRIPEEL